MLLALRPDITFVELRGNIDTRLRKWSEGQCDALVLASAGLDRLNRTEHVHQRFTIDELTPAPGQGALALQTRCPKSLGICHPEAQPKDLLSGRGEDARDTTIHAIIRTLNCETTAYAVTAERAVLHALGGGCQLPLGAYAHQVDDHWHLHAMVASPDGDQTAQVLQKSPLATPAETLGQLAAEALKARGALELLVHPVHTV
jgi:hydroxymethylbilane synthase